MDSVRMLIRQPISAFVFGFLAIVSLGIGGYSFFSVPVAPPVAAVSYKTPAEANKFVRFDMEGFDDILAKYWMKTSEADVAGLYQLALQKAQSATTTASLPELTSKDRAGTAMMLAKAFLNLSDADAKTLAVNTLIVALYNLQPAGRNNLLSAQQEVQLRQEVANVNPAKDLYADLGVAKGADTGAVDTAYKAKAAELQASSSPAAKEELQKVTYAHEVLADTGDKARYDQGQIEPTIFSHTIGSTLYLYVKQISPTTLQEFGQAIEAASTTKMDSMVLDLRGNIGGALDFASFFLALFVGPNQYAFDFFQQGNYLPQRTPGTLGVYQALARYKDIAVLTDNMTQSTAEVLTAMFKRFHLAHVVGTATRGWGTVENTIPLTTEIDPAQKFSILMVQYLTLRDDGQPVEGKGVDPDVNINDKNWQSELPTYFRSASIIDALRARATKPPLQ